MKRKFINGINLDEDELKEALESKIITKSDYKMAYDTCNKVIKEMC